MAKNQKEIVVREQATDAVARRRNELVVAPFRLSLQAQRLFLYMVSLVQEDQTHNKPFEFSVYKLAKEIGIARTNLYAEMIRVLDELERTKVVIPDRDDPKKMVRIGLIKNKQKATKSNQKGVFFLDGILELYVYEELLPYIRALAGDYTEVELKYVFRLGSSYSQKMYDILKSEAWKGRRYEVKLVDLYKMLAVEKGKFERYQDFRRFVLERACVEINDKTDLRFTWSTKKKGRKIDTIVFMISVGGGSNLDVLAGSHNDKLYKALRSYKMPAKECGKLIEKYGKTDPQIITWHVSELRRLEAAGKVKVPLAWLRAALKKDYRPQRAFRFDDGKTVAQSNRAETAADKRKRDAAQARNRSGSVNPGMKPLSASFGKTLEKLKTNSDSDPLAKTLAEMGEGVAKRQAQQDQ